MKFIYIIYFLVSSYGIPLNAEEKCQQAKNPLVEQVQHANQPIQSVLEAFGAKQDTWEQVDIDKGNYEFKNEISYGSFQEFIKILNKQIKTNPQVGKCHLSDLKLLRKGKFEYMIELKISGVTSEPKIIKIKRTDSFNYWSPGALGFGKKQYMTYTPTESAEKIKLTSNVDTQEIQNIELAIASKKIKCQE